jgi:hypothetical protein
LPDLLRRPAVFEALYYAFAQLRIFEELMIVRTSIGPHHIRGFGVSPAFYSASLRDTQLCIYRFQNDFYGEINQCFLSRFRIFGSGHQSGLQKVYNQYYVK